MVVPADDGGRGSAEERAKPNADHESVVQN